MVKTRKMGGRRRDRYKSDRGGDLRHRVEAPFEWSWRHALIPHYLTGKFTKKGPNLKESVNEVFTWKGIYNKGAKVAPGAKGGRRRTRRCGKRCRKRCTRRKFRKNHRRRGRRGRRRRRRRRTLRGGLPSPTSLLKYVGGKPSGCPPLNGLWSAGIDSAKPCSLL